MGDGALIWNNPNRLSGNQRRCCSFRAASIIQANQEGLLLGEMKSRRPFISAFPFFAGVRKPPRKQGRRGGKIRCPRARRTNRSPCEDRGKTRDPKETNPRPGKESDPPTWVPFFSWVDQRNRHWFQILPGDTWYLEYFPFPLPQTSSSTSSASPPSHHRIRPVRGKLFQSLRLPDQALHRLLPSRHCRPDSRRIPDRST